jgi:hypothetical protein
LATVTPASSTVAKGDTLQLTAPVTGTAMTSVNWSIVGDPGTQGTISSFGVYDSSTATAARPFTLTAQADDNGTKGTATITVVDSSVHSVSGNIAYAAGIGFSHIIITVETQSDGTAVGGTSIVGPGPYRIRCLRNSGSYRVRAWGDVAGMVKPVFADDPRGIYDFTFDGSNDVSAANFSLNDPVDSTPASAPTVQGIFASAQGGGVDFKPVTDMVGFDVASHYDVFASTTPNPSATNSIYSRSIPGWASPLALVPFVPGQSYYVSVAAVNAAGTGPPLLVGPIVAANSNGGSSTVSGKILLNGFPATGPLDAYLFDPAGTKSWGQVFNPPSATNNYSLANVIDGAYGLGAFIDQGGDGILGPLDPQVRFDRFVVTGDTIAPDLAFSSANATVTIATDNSHDAAGGGAPTDRYSIDFRIKGNVKLPMSATLLGGPGLGTGVPLDMPVDRQSTDEELISLRFIDVAALPVAGDAYPVLMTYTDGTSEVLSPVVSGSVGTATNLTPSTVGVGASPAINFTPPVPAPSVYTFSVGVFDNSFNLMWEVEQLPSTTTLPLAYNFDGTGLPLQLGTQYQLWVYIHDSSGNQSSAGVNFTP